MITWPTSPIPPPPIARRSTPRWARASARTARAPGWFGSWTTNWRAMDTSPDLGRPILTPRGDRRWMAALAWPAPARARNRRAGRAGNGDRPAVGVEVGRRWARGPVVVDGHPPPNQAGPGGRIGPRVECPLAGPGQPIRRGILEDEARAGAGAEVFVREGSGQAAGSMDPRRGAIAQGDHLALAARFEPAGHEEQVAAGVDPAGHHPVESLVQDDPLRPPPGEGPEGRRQRRIATALDDQPGAGRQELRHGLGQEIETLLRIEPANHPQDGPVVARIEANPLEQVGPTDPLAGRIQEPVGGSEVG